MLYVSRADSSVVSTPSEQATSMLSCSSNALAVEGRKVEIASENTLVEYKNRFVFTLSSQDPTEETSE